MSLLTDVGALYTGFKGDKKANKYAKKEYKQQKKLTKQQTAIADYIQQLSKQAATTPSNIYDPSGGYTRYNPVTGQYEYDIGPKQGAIQGASYEEELARNTQDQAMRRAGLRDFERMRQVSSDRATRALTDIDAARRGIGMVDPRAVAGTMATDRSRALNAGYDDAERAARTMQLRTGSSAVGDALSTLARDRARAQASMGSPDLEAAQYAQELNMPRTQQNYGAYGAFGDEARNFYDAQFQPSAYEQLGRENLGKQMEFDLNKLDLAMGGSANAAGAISNAARGQTGAYGAFVGSRVKSPFSNLLTGYSNMEDAAAKKFATGGFG